MRWILRKGVVGVCVAWACSLHGAGLQSAVTATKSEQGGAAPVMSEKQKKLLEDTDKLVQMAAELKVSVDKSNKNELSLDVVRKAEAVEKLARSVKERIREAR